MINELEISKLIEVAQGMVHSGKMELSEIAICPVQDLEFNGKIKKLCLVICDNHDDII